MRGPQVCNNPVKWTNLAFLPISISILLSTTAHIAASEGSTATVSDREQSGLRGPVKSCTEESTFTYAGLTDAEGKTIPDVHSESTTDYDTAGRILVVRHGQSDGSQWVARYDYDASGRLLKRSSGIEGQASKATTYSYDQQGRLQTIAAGGSDSPVTFRYDEHGRKTKIAISSPADYRPNVAVGGDPFEAVDRAPNLPGGGSATTIYDEQDRATEVQVRDASGELVNRAVRTYDAQGHMLEEKQIWDDPVRMFPADAFAEVLEKSGMSLDQLREEMRPQLAKLMAGPSGAYSVSYEYDAQDRVTHTSRRVFKHIEDEIETTYNQKGDVISEVTRSTRPTGETEPTTPTPGPPAYSEARHSYQYDQHENWIEKADSFRSSADGAFQPSNVTKRKLTYY
jgi:YD repeat-containing protein